MELFLSQSTLNILVKGSVARKTSVSTSGKQQDVNGASNEVSAREKLLHDQHGLLQQFGLDLLPVLTQGEDLDMSSIEIGDDALMIEDDDVSDDEDDYHEKVLRDDSLPVCIPENVHDVKLGDTADDPAAPSAARDNHTQLSSASYRTTTARGSESAEFRSGSPFGSRGAMAFAAAAVTGLASVSSRGISGGRDRRGVPYGSSDQYNKLIFTVGGKQLSKHLTIYQAVQCQLVLDADDDERFNGSDLLNDGSRFWSDIFKITCQKADGQMDRGSQGNSPSSVLKYSKSYSASNSAAEIRGQLVSFLDIILQGELLCDLEKSNPTYNILALLRVMEELNKLAPRLRVQAVADDFAEGKVSSLDEFYQTGAKVPPEEFINSKLTPKLARQIQDALALCSGSLPSWHVFRNYILDSAAKVMEMYSAVLEVEYFGTGLGPNLEFCTRLSHVLQKVGLGLWRSTSASDAKKLGSDLAESRNFEQAPLSLLTRPWPPWTEVSEGSQLYKVIIEYFFPLSHVMAKARQDGQLLDLPLSLAFYKLVLGEELDLYDILSFEAEFGKILHEMQILVSRKKFLGEEGGGNQRAIADLRFRGAPIEDLCLDFSLPGYPEYILKEEESTVVNINDLEEYISSVVDATVKAGITRQMEAFRAGFNQLRPWIKTGVHKYLDNSGDFDESVSAAENDNGASSGNMNFEERVHPQTRANYEATDQGYNANKGLDGDGNAEEGNPPKEQSGSNIMKYDECPNCELRGTMLPQDSSNVDWLGHRIMSFAVRHQERFGTCWAFTTCDATTFVHGLDNPSRQLLTLSPQSLIDLRHLFIDVHSEDFVGDKDGLSLFDAFRIAREMGIMMERHRPYKGPARPGFSKKKKWQKLYKVENFVEIRPSIQ